jgi:hypothetical protein
MATREQTGQQWLQKQGSEIIKKYRYKKWEQWHPFEKSIIRSFIERRGYEATRREIKRVNDEINPPPPKIKITKIQFPKV